MRHTALFHRLYRRPCFKRSATVAFSSTSVSVSSVSLIQQLYDSLKVIPDVTTSINDPSTCPHLSKCLTLMNDFSLDHVGLEKYKLTAIKESVCMNICSTQKFDIAIFIVPCGWSMPLHDHPNMAVLSKLLHGEALCTSYTPLYSCKTNNSERVISNSPNSESSSLATGSFHMRAVETKNVQCPAWYLTPNQDNIHSIHAMSSCKGDSAEPAVLLDVLLPPYDSISRPCSYYTATPQPMWQPTVPVGLKTNTSGTSQIIEEWKWKKWIIEECDEPTDLLPYGVEYTGETPVK